MGKTFTAGELSRTKAWKDVQAMIPIITAHRDEANALRRLPDAIAEAFVAHDIYRLMLPTDLGGAGIDIIQQFDLVLEVARHDASTAWNYSLALGGWIRAGFISPGLTREMFATADCGSALSFAPAGRAVAGAGGYTVSGRHAWASGIHQARWVSGGCIVIDGDTPRIAPNGGPTIIHFLVPIEEVHILDTWHTMGMRGTGSTEFVVDDLFVPQARALTLFGGTPTQPHAIFKLPVNLGALGLAAVPLGAALSAIAELKELAQGKQQPGGATMADKPSLQFTLAKAQTMVEAAILATRDAASCIWAEVQSVGVTSLTSRARLFRSMAFAVDTAVEAVNMCFREAGGSGVFDSTRFGQVLRDVNVIAGHHVFQRDMMENAGRIELGLNPTRPM